MFARSRVARYANTIDHHDISERIRAMAQTKNSWSDTLALPKSKFPARPSGDDIERYRTRCADDLYQWQRSHRSFTSRVDRDARDGENHTTALGSDFVLHDGPPYANGAVHVGHALNKTQGSDCSIGACARQEGAVSSGMGLSWPSNRIKGVAADQHGSINFEIVKRWCQEGVRSHIGYRQSNESS